MRADRVTEVSLRAQYVPFDDLLARSDILSVHTPLTDQTRGMVGREAFARMKPGAIVINTARGKIVDEEALYQALVEGRLGGAGIDAYAVEPLPADHPLLKLDHVVLTPHSGGGVFDNVENVARHVVDNMRKRLADEPFSPPDVIVAPRAAAQAS